MTTVVNTPPAVERSDSSAGWMVAVLILLAVVGIGVYLWYNYRGLPPADTTPANINVSVPILQLPAETTPSE